ncbi:putative phosphoglycerate mutase [Bacillus mesophilus]|uniref:Histidine phosphatase family protein n=1 Tax=Bacillus mesophilus TaxID=1808955 RepID=A0A6M0Q9Y7_9BACI|nr:histidine phosphatase family protein [Bacillus mesophilus]MBM7660574.1 putative phosphoglycerate mutase [Bacillus mesophilus]NEY71878.1 histidine phosphatase family protein [Bacillus mesophilus]
MTTIGIIRHGRTQWNSEGRAQGNADIPLNDEGILGANLLAERLKREQWNVVYSSDLLRAKQTADLIVHKTRIPIEIDVRLREVGGGLIEGTTEEERIKKWGTDWRKLDLGIEKDEIVVLRAKAFLNEITERHDGEKILLVTHGAFIRKLLRHLFKDELPSSLHNTSFTQINKVGDSWQCGLYNCIKHLEQDII